MPEGTHVAIGLVTDNKDPLEQGRVRVQYPWLSEADVSDWARIASPMAGKDRGFQFLPEVGDEVLVAFEHGDMHRPIVIGALWNGVDKTVQPSSQLVNGEGVVHRVIKTRIGHELLFDDTGGKGEVKITTLGKNVFTLNDRDKKITVNDVAGNKIEIDTASNTITVTSMKDFNVDATGKVSIKGAMGITIDSPISVDVHGAKVSVKGDAMVEVKAAIVNINT